MALTINYTTENGWPPVVATGDGDACLADVINTLVSWIYSSGNVTIFVDTSSATSLGAAGANNSAGTISGTDDYATQVNLLASITDEYPNNIKSIAYATIPGYPSAVNGDNPFPSRTSFTKRTKHTNAIITNTTFDGLVGFGEHGDIVSANENPSPNFNWDATASQTSVPSSGRAKLWATIFHEWSHMFGRASSAFPGSADSVTRMSLIDLFMYSGSGARNLSLSGTRYLSLDGGVTSLGACNQSGSGDFEGFVADGSVQSPFTYQTLVGVSRKPRFEDVQLMSILGLPLTKTGLIAAGLPNATAVPTITGTPGSTLTANTGTWAGHGTITKQQWQWQRNGVDVGGATGSTFDSSGGTNAGTTITVVETASNWIGDNTATSAGVTVSAVGAPSFGSISLQMHR